jgi:phosphopantothenoylcysteine decarboxylase/phosphopantothenate--cysteine ligase
MGGDMNTVHLVSKDGVEDWPSQTKEQVASALVQRIAAVLGEAP